MLQYEPATRQGVKGNELGRPMRDRIENVCGSLKGSLESCFQMLSVAVGISCPKEGLRAGTRPLGSEPPAGESQTSLVAKGMRKS